MLHIFNLQTHTYRGFSEKRARMKTTNLCPAPCCDSFCDQCPERRCLHSEHGTGGSCVSRIVPGTGIWLLNGRAFNSREHVRSAIAGLATYEEEGQIYIRDDDLPATAHMAGWVEVVGDYECLAYLPAGTLVSDCRCEEQPCEHASEFLALEAMAKPDAPRKQAGSQRAHLLAKARETLPIPEKETQQ